MKIVNPAVAGTMESGDIMIEIRNSEENGIHIDLESSVMNQYGRQIRKVIEETVRSCGLDNVDVIANDKGSLDCTIRARVTTAAMRGIGQTEFSWK